MYESVELIYYRQIFLRLKAFRRLKRAGSSISGATLLSCASDLSNSLFHFLEHFRIVRNLSRSQVETLCPAFPLVGDVANVLKHGTATKDTPHGPPLVGTATDVNEVEIIVGYTDAQGPYWHSEKCIAVNASTDPGVLLDNYLVDVCNFWRQQLEIAGLRAFPSTRKFKEAGTYLVARNKAKFNGIEIIPGLPFSARFNIKIFDPASRSSTPFSQSTNVEPFLKKVVVFKFRFMDGDQEVVDLASYEPLNAADLHVLIEKLKQLDASQFVGFMSGYGVDLASRMRDRIELSSKGRVGTYEFDVANRLALPAGRVKLNKIPS